MRLAFLSVSGLFRNATSTTDVIVKQLLCSTAVSDHFSTVYSNTEYQNYLCATRPT